MYSQYWACWCFINIFVLFSFDSSLFYRNFLLLVLQESKSKIGISSGKKLSQNNFTVYLFNFSEMKNLQVRRRIEDWRKIENAMKNVKMLPREVVEIACTHFDIEFKICKNHRQYTCCAIIRKCENSKLLVYINWCFDKLCPWFLLQTSFS